MADRAARIGVPPVAYESHHWAPDPAGYYSRAELRRQTGDYVSSIPGELAALAVDLDAAVAADLDDASRALTDFGSYATAAFGADVPSLGPMSAILLRTESASSSQIENLTASARQLALAEIDAGDKANARLVVGNVRAMETAFRDVNTIDRQAILTIHRDLLAGDHHLSQHAGRFRQELVWIGRDSAGPRNADYVAPQHGLIGSSIEDLVAFIERDDLPPLLQAAIAHAQFETIHPFVDGNGRTGRALVHALLKVKGVLDVSVPLSAGLLRDTAAYFDALTEFRGGDAGPIVRQFSAAARYAAFSGRELVDDLRGQLAADRESMSGIRAHALAWQVLPLLIGQPVVNSRYLQNSLKVSESAALRALGTLVERGIVEERTGMRRNRVWQNSGILAILDDYAEKIRRPMPGRGLSRPPRAIT